MTNPVDYLRISLTDRCNFRCHYCMPEEGELDYVLKQNLLTGEELLTLLREVFIPLGFKKFRLTGGEPLLRPGIVEIVRQIANLSATKDLSLTTNGFLFAPLAADLYEAGLRRVNISLDSLDPDTFNEIIGNRGRSRWEQTWESILRAHQLGFNPLKINVVVIPGVNEAEVEALAALSIDRPWHVRFIEFMPIGNTSLFEKRAWIPSEELRQRIGQKWGLESGSVLGNGPADIFQISGALGTLGFISQMSECFCARCNRMRLSADGWLRPCLLNENHQLDLKTPLRQGVSLGELREQVGYLLALKPEINFQERDRGTSTGIYSRTMSQIGG
jgi:cyclic pyranopterin phosphate synthase